MASLFIDSCGDSYTGDSMMDRWDYTANNYGALPQIVPGRTGNCLKMEGGFDTEIILRKNLISDESHIFFGFAYLIPSLPNSGNELIWELQDNGVFTAGLFVDSVGRIRFSANNTTIAGPVTAGSVVNDTGWVFIESEILFSNTTGGTVEVRVNGLTQFRQTGIQTAALSSAICNQFVLHGNVPRYFDDLYFNDATDTGEGHTSFEGDSKVIPGLIIANGHDQDFLPSGAAQAYQCVNEIGSDHDTTFIYSSTAGNKSTFLLGPLPSGITEVTAVQVCLSARKDDAFTRVFSPLVSNGTTDSAGAEFSAPSTYRTFTYSFGINPVTSAAWQLTDFNHLEVGVELNS